MSVSAFVNPARRRMIAGVLAMVVALQSAGCGTIIHPERRGQKSGRLDPSIVILDGLGLLFFFVPGAVAFVVDFATGAIYLPESYGARSHGAPGRVRLTRIDTDPRRLDKQRIESVIRAQTGKSIDLDAAEIQVTRLQRLDEASIDRVNAANRLDRLPDLTTAGTGSQAGIR